MIEVSTDTRIIRFDMHRIFLWVHLTTRNRKSRPRSKVLPGLASKENLANDVLKLRRKYGLSMDDASVETTVINEWKYLIKNSVKNYALRCLIKHVMKIRKSRVLKVK